MLMKFLSGVFLLLLAPVLAAQSTATPAQTGWWLGASTPPAGNVARGAVRHPCIQITITRNAAATSSVTLTDMFMAQLGTMPAGYFDQMELWEDVNGDGAADAGDTLLLQQSFPATISFNSPPLAPIAPGMSAHLLITVNLSQYAPLGDAFQLVADPGLTGGLLFSPTGSYTPSWAGPSGVLAGAYGKVQTVVDAIPPLVITTQNPLPDGIEGAPYACNIDAAGGTGTYLWSLAGGALPPGLVLGSSGNPATLTGTPVAAGTYSFTLEVTDGASTATELLTITVIAQAVGGPAAPPNPGGGAGNGGCVVGAGAMPILLGLLCLFLASRRKEA